MYDDAECSGRGTCISGLCVCSEPYSGDWCHLRAPLDEATHHVLAGWTRLIAGGVLLLGGIAHLLAWILAGGVLSTAQVVTGDFRSLMLTLQFIGMTSLLDADLPTQYFSAASYFRVFALNVDPKDVFEGLGVRWSSSLTTMCYSSAPGGGNSTLSSQDIDFPAFAVAGGVLDWRKQRLGRVGRVPVDASELVTGWGGYVGSDPQRGALEVSFRLLCGTAVSCYTLLLLTSLVRRLVCWLMVGLRRRTRRQKKLRQIQAIEARYRQQMEPEVRKGAGAVEALVSGHKFGEQTLAGASEEKRLGRDAELDADGAMLVGVRVDNEELNSTSVQVAAGDFGFGRWLPSKAVAWAETGPAIQRGQGSEEGRYAEASDSHDDRATCGACGKRGHWHESCQDLNTVLLDPRCPQELAPAQLCFPCWEVNACIFTINGMAVAIGSVVARAGPAGCMRMHAVLVLLLPSLCFVSWVFWRVQRSLLAGTGGNLVWWRSNSYTDAASELLILQVTATCGFVTALGCFPHGHGGRPMCDLWVSHWQGRGMHAFA